MNTSHPRGRYKTPVRRASEIYPFLSLALDANKNVTDLLHKLRGEQFRQQLNQRRTTPTSHVAARRALHLIPYAHVFSLEDGSTSPLPVQPPPHTAGPVPRSWLPTAPPTDYSAPTWLANALAIFITYASRLLENMLSPVPSLSLLCIRKLLETCNMDADTLAVLRPYLPPHARLLLLRETAVHAPLSRASYAALLEPNGHAGGEVIAVGSSQVDILRSIANNRPSNQNLDLEEWDADEGADGDEDLGPDGVALLNAPLPSLQILPPSLTRLALVHLPIAAPVHRLPERCPLLEVLDLSYNSWLTSAAFGEETVLARVRWTRWTRLRVLGLRGTGLRRDSDILSGVNEGRWVDGTLVEIIV